MLISKMLFTSFARVCGKKTEPPLIHEEKKKIKLFGRTVVELNTIEENISQD